MLKGTSVINCRKVHRQIVGLKGAGKDEREIAEALGLTPATIQYVTAICSQERPGLYGGGDNRADQKPKLAYEMWQAGKGIAEINQKLQVTTARARQMIHRYAWTLRHQ